MRIAPAMVVIMLAACSAPPAYDLGLRVTSPAPMAMMAGPQWPTVALASYADDWSYVRLYLASDRRTDNAIDHAPQRISVVSNLGASSYWLGQGAAVLYRDDAAGIDCSDWTGVLEWQATSVEINGWCNTSPVRLVASLTGDYVETAIARMLPGSTP
jgi:hypothetical protein